MLKRGKSSSITQAVVLCNSPFCIIKSIFYSPFQEAHVFYFPSSNFALHILILRHGNFNRSRSRDMVIYIVNEFESFSLLRPDSQLDNFDSHSCAQLQLYRHLRIETTAKMGEHTTSKNTFIALTK